MTTRIPLVFKFAVLGATALASVFFVSSFASAAAVPSVALTVRSQASDAILTSAPVGTQVYARTVVSSSTATSPLQGSVDFSLYDNQTCSGSPATQNNVALNDIATARSSAATVGRSGLSYRVHYDGENNLYSEADSACVSVATTSAPVETGDYSIRGTVYNDANRNDIQDTSEEGLAGWTISLHKQGAKRTLWKIFHPLNSYDMPVVATATTDESGNYSFGNLAAGTYFVEEQVASGWKQTSSDTKLVLSASDTSADVDFANVQKVNNGDGDGDQGRPRDNDDKPRQSDSGRPRDNDNGAHFWGWVKSHNTIWSYDDNK